MPDRLPGRPPESAAGPPPAASSPEGAPVAAPGKAGRKAEGDSGRKTGRQVGRETGRETGKETGSDEPRRAPSLRRRAAGRLRALRWRIESARRSRRFRSLAEAPAPSPDAASPPGGPGSGPTETPTFDLRGFHPIGWQRDDDGRVGALGPPGRLPPGTRATRPVPPGALRRLRRLHHLEDTAAFHEDARSRAATLARLAAAGVLIHLADDSEALQQILGEDLYRLLKTEPAGLDPAAREVLGARMRRAALWRHSRWARLRHAGEREFPRVSVLLATRRPGFLAWALANLARQTYPNLELLLGLHGDDFPEVETRLAALPCPARVVRAPREEALGAVLNALATAARGPLLTKMDDDDLYGPDHLRDLVLAREYSGAALVGKWVEFLYLAKPDCTLQWCNGESERFQATALAGPTLLLSRTDLERAGGFRPLPRRVDLALVADVVESGGRVYRTHGAGFLMIRHGQGHTWDSESADDDRFLARADRIWPGFHPARAGVEPLPRPHPGLGDTGRHSGAGEPSEDVGPAGEPSRPAR